VVGEISDDRAFDTVTTQVELLIPGDRWRLRLAGDWADYSAEYKFARRAAFEPLLAEALGRPPTVEDSADLRVTGGAFGASASLQLMPSEQLTLDLGLRWDRQRYDLGFDEDQVSPRVGAQYQLDPDTLLRLSWGRLAQAQRPDELQVADGETWFNAPARATQTVLAAERRVSREAVLRLEAFDKRVSRVLPAYENVLDPRSLLAEIEPDRLRVAPDSSRTYGAELSGRWEPRQEWASWLAYTWSEATDEFEDGDEAERTWNQQHSVVLGVAWTRHPWQLSANGRWNSGWRRNTIDSEFNLSPRNRQSWSDSKSIDLRASWSRDLPLGALSVFVEVINALDHDNLCCTRYTVEDAGGVPTLTSETTTWLPRYALVGVTWTLP
jgi:outer membrane receptor protein involved in Fe transport